MILGSNLVAGVPNKMSFPPRPKDKTSFASCILASNTDLMLPSTIGQPKAIPLTELNKCNQNIISYIMHHTEGPGQPFKRSFFSQLE